MSANTVASEISAMTWCRACGGTGDEWVGEDAETCAICSGAGEHAADRAYGIVDADGGRVVYNGNPTAPAVAVMTDLQALAEIGWVAAQARRIAGAEASDAEVLEYFVRKAAVLEHIACTQIGDQRRATHDLAAQARAEVAARTAPAVTRGQQLGAIADDLDATTAAWAAAGHPMDGPEHDAREAVFVRLRAWNAAG